jgi:hypothetical protein
MHRKKISPSDSHCEKGARGLIFFFCNLLQFDCVFSGGGLNQNEKNEKKISDSSFRSD